MEVQIFGVKKSADTRKALRFFAERRVRTHFVDFDERAPALGELRRFVQKFGIEAIVDRDGSVSRDGPQIRTYSEQRMLGSEASRGSSRLPLAASSAAAASPLASPKASEGWSVSDFDAVGGVAVEFGATESSGHKLHIAAGERWGVIGARYGKTTLFSLITASGSNRGQVSSSRTSASRPGAASRVCRCDHSVEVAAGPSQSYMRLEASLASRRWRSEGLGRGGEERYSRDSSVRAEGGYPMPPRRRGPSRTRFDRTQPAPADQGTLRRERGRLASRAIGEPRRRALLDEPTITDLETAAWLEQYLKSSQQTFSSSAMIAPSCGSNDHILHFEVEPLPYMAATRVRDAARGAALSQQRAFDSSRRSSLRRGLHRPQLAVKTAVRQRGVASASRDATPVRDHRDEGQWRSGSRLRSVR